MRTRRLSFVAIIVGIAILLASLPCSADEEEQRIRTIERASKAVVSVRTYRKNQEKPGIGSGVIIHPNGYIVTNAHVVKNAETIKVQLFNKKIFNASIWKLAKEQDLAILKINAGNIPSVRMGDSNSVRVGQTVIAIGDPLGFTGTVTIGMISGLHRNVETKGIKYRDLIQTDAAINPGSSGGALFNNKGEVIGINALVYNGPANGYDKAQGLGFAIPIQTVKDITQEIDSYEYAGGESIGAEDNGVVESSSESKSRRQGGRAWLGISGETLTPQKANDYNVKIKTGVLIKSVTAGSPAKRAKLRTGDAISGINNKPITSASELSEELRHCHPGDVIRINVWRGEKMFIIKLKLESQG